MTSLLYVVVVISAYLGFGAVADIFGLSIINGKSAVCVIGGSVIGGLISIPLFDISKSAGFVGIGLGIAIMAVLVYTKLASWLFGFVPDSWVVKIGTVLGVIKSVLFVIMILVIIAVIVLAVTGLLHVLV